MAAQDGGPDGPILAVEVSPALPRQYRVAVMTEMFFLVMLLPFGLLGLMLGMERLERWMTQEKQES